MQLKLTLKTTGESWTLQPDKEYTIGRDQNCDIALPSVVTISSRHLKVMFDKLTNQWCIKDLGSSNGTFVRSQRVTDAVIQGVTEIQLSQEVHLVAVPDMGAIPTVMSPMAARPNPATNPTVISSNVAATNFPSHSNVAAQETNPKEYGNKPIKRRLAFPIISVTLITVLAAIAMPSFLNQANKAKQSEAKQFSGTIARSEQAYYLENSKFATTLDELGKNNIYSDHNDYVHWIYPIGSNAVQQIAMPKKQTLKTYTSVVAVDSRNSTNSTNVAMCESLEAGPAPLDFLVKASSLSSGTAVCPPGFKPLGR
jgi:type IV pilus assembly protein PilA